MITPTEKVQETKEFKDFPFWGICNLLIHCLIEKRVSFQYQQKIIFYKGKKRSMKQLKKDWRWSLLYHHCIVGRCIEMR
jgi:hypothetical protein